MIDIGSVRSQTQNKWLRYLFNMSMWILVLGSPSILQSLPVTEYTWHQSSYPKLIQPRSRLLFPLLPLSISSSHFCYLALLLTLIFLVARVYLLSSLLFSLLGSAQGHVHSGLSWISLPLIILPSPPTIPRYSYILFYFSFFFIQVGQSFKVVVPSWPSDP